MDSFRALSTSLALVIALVQPLPVHAFSEPTTRLWHRPTQASIHLLSKFSLPNGPYNAGHRGIDILAAHAASIFSPGNGIVHFIGTVVDREIITLALSKELLVSFEPVSSALKIGERVKRGQKIATLSAGAHCSSHCLHIGVRRNGEYQNPMKWYASKPQLLQVTRSGKH